MGTGTNVTICCWNKDYGAAFLLHKDGRSAPIQRLVPDDVGAVSFTLFGVTPADSGTYRCSYRPRNYSFLSSPLGDIVTLEVTPTAAQPLTTATTRFPRDTNSAPVGYRYLGVFIPSITSMGKGCDDTATHGWHWGQTHGGQVPTWGCRCGCHLQCHAVPKG